MYEASNRCQVTFWLKPSEFAQLRQAVNSTGLSRSEYIRQVLRNTLKEGTILVFPPTQQATDEQDDPPCDETMGAAFGLWLDE